MLERAQLQRHGAERLKDTYMVMDTICDATQERQDAVHSLVETISVRNEGAAEIAHCYATNVFHKGPTGWRLVMHHASAAPVEAGMLDLNDVPGLLH